MTQQINLYQPMFRREKKVFSAAVMVQMGFVAAFGFMLIYGYSYWQSVGVADNVSTLESNRDAMQENLLELTRQFPAKQKSKLLEKKIEQLSVELEERHRVSTALSSGDFGDVNGFGDHLEALARQHVEGTWLTRVSVASGGRSVGIAGSALFPELIPAYIQRLSAEAVFSGFSFDVLELQRAGEGRSQVDFVLSSGEEP